MLTIDLYSRIPIYQQVIDGIKEQVLLGILREGEQIPSIRELSVEISTNPNTVSKSYSELERTGVLHAAVGKGYFVAIGASERIRKDMVFEERKTLIGAAENLKRIGITEEELQTWLREVYQNEATKEKNET